MLEAVYCTPLSVRTPIAILHLLFDELLQIDAFVELIRFCSRIADPALGVEILCNLRERQQCSWPDRIVITRLHDSLTVHP